jgi:hypothetical protein
MRAVLIPAPVEIVPGSRMFTVQPARLVELPTPTGGDDHDSVLEALRGFVDGSVERIEMPLGHDGWINAEGHFVDGHTVNTHADDLWRKAVREWRDPDDPESRITTIPGDYVAGSVVVTGPVGPEGRCTAVTDEFVELLRGQHIMPAVAA